MQQDSSSKKSFLNALKASFDQKVEKTPSNLVNTFKYF